MRAAEFYRRIAAILTNHGLSLFGTGLVTTAGILWLFFIPQETERRASNPYTGIVLLVLPVVFFAGLIFIPLGAYVARDRIRVAMMDQAQHRDARRRLITFLLVTTFANVVIGAQLTYRSVRYMETDAFCGQTCHVMKPEFTAHQVSPHANVECVACHVAPGVEGWVHAKMNGTRQLFEVLLDNYPRPIPSAVESNRLVSSRDTCDNCHSTARDSGSKLRVVTAFKDDEANTATHTVLMMKVGGGAHGGIHGAHLGQGVAIRYAPADPKRQTIPWVEYRNQGRGISRTYAAFGATRSELAKLPKFEMQCTDCHNRPAHTFESPERAVQRALSRGEVSRALPFINKTLLAVLKETYGSAEEAEKKIPEKIREYYKASYPDIQSQRSAEIEEAGRAAVQIYRQNVFSDLKVTWGTYPNNLGHTDFPGCFRCHDDAHVSAENKTIGQDCASCHEMLAVDEPNPEVLKTLGLLTK